MVAKKKMVMFAIEPGARTHWLLDCIVNRSDASPEVTWELGTCYEELIGEELVGVRAEWLGMKGYNAIFEDEPDKPFFIPKFLVTHIKGDDTNGS